MQNKGSNTDERREGEGGSRERKGKGERDLEAGETIPHRQKRRIFG